MRRILHLTVVALLVAGLAGGLAPAVADVAGTSVSPRVWDGTTYQPTRNAVNGVNGAHLAVSGLQAVVPYALDSTGTTFAPMCDQAVGGTNCSSPKVNLRSPDGTAIGGDPGDNNSGNAAIGAFTTGWDGSTWDRLRTVDGAADGSTTGILADGSYVWSPHGSVWLKNRGQSSPVQGGHTGATTLLNTQATSGANAAVSTTLTGVAGQRVHLYKVTWRCSAAPTGTPTLTVTDNGTTIWSTAAVADIAATNKSEPWNPGLTISTGSTAVVTLGACGAALTGTIMVQADQF